MSRYKDPSVRKIHLSPVCCHQLGISSFGVQTLDTHLMLLVRLDTLNLVNIFFANDLAHINWLRGPMARRLTTNQEIPGSTPGVIIVLSFAGTVDYLFAGGDIRDS